MSNYRAGEVGGFTQRLGCLVEAMLLF